jgi:hypothetical protein
MAVRDSLRVELLVETANRTFSVGVATKGWEVWKLAMMYQLGTIEEGCDTVW